MGRVLLQLPQVYYVYVAPRVLHVCKPLKAVYGWRSCSLRMPETDAKADQPQALHYVLMDTKTVLAVYSASTE